MKYFIAMLLLIASFVFPVSLVFADFPTAYLPNGTRPRLWLSTERLSALTTSMQANSSEWVRFKNYCDALLTEDPWQGVETGIAPLALIYRLTGDERYATRAFEFMDSVPNTIADNRDVAHVDYGFLALGYDWLYNHSLMTSVRRNAYIAKMEALSQEIWTGYNDSGTVETGKIPMLFLCPVRITFCLDVRFMEILPKPRPCLIMHGGYGNEDKVLMLPPKGNSIRGHTLFGTG